MKSKIKKAEKRILKALRKRGKIRAGDLKRKYPDLPIAYGLWALHRRKEIKRKAWGEYIAR